MHVASGDTKEQGEVWLSCCAFMSFPPVPEKPVIRGVIHVDPGSNQFFSTEIDTYRIIIMISLCAVHRSRTQSLSFFLASRSMIKDLLFC